MKRLALSKETLRHLDAEAAAQVAGGIIIRNSFVGCTSFVDACPSMRCTLLPGCPPPLSIPLCATL